MKTLIKFYMKDYNTHQTVQLWLDYYLDVVSNQMVPNKTISNVWCLRIMGVYLY